MKHQARELGALVCLTLGVLPASASTAYADGNGREWRQVSDTKGISWDEMAAVCPLQGASPCRGGVDRIGVDLGGWTWATREQVKDLFNILLSDLPQFAAADRLPAEGGLRSGQHIYWLAASALTSAFEPTFVSATNYSTSIGVAGMTSTRGSNGQVVLGTFGYGHGMVRLDGHFAIEIIPSAPSFAGAWLWRPSMSPRTAVAIQAIPEPGTTAMWALGAAFISLAWARRVRAQVQSHCSSASHSGALSMKPTVDSTMPAVASGCRVL